MLEKDLVRKIRHYLDSLDCCFSWKEHGGMYGTAGIPDIICCIRGKFVALEVKLPGNRPTSLQEMTMARIRKAGGTAEAVYSLDDVKRIISATEKCDEQ